MRILFVCTGNLCRSPMAEHLMKRSLSRALRVTPDGLGARGWIVESVGTHAYEGLEMPENARKALAELDIPGARHDSRLLRVSHLAAADVVYGAAQEHIGLMRDLSAAVAPKLRPIDPARDVDDPMGQGLDVYRATAWHLQGRIEALTRELLRQATDGAK